MIESTRTRIILLCVLSLLWFPFRGKANRIVQDTRRVGTIYLTRNVGDMVFCTPIFRALKNARPESEMYVIGRKRNADTLRYNPDVSRYIEYPDSLFVLWKTVRSLQLQYAFLVNPSVLELAILYLANVPAIATFSAPIHSAETKTYKILKRMCIRVEFTLGNNFALENLKLLAPLGIISSDVRKHLNYSEEAKESIKQFFALHNVTPQEDLIIALAPGAGTKVKQWPAKHFAELADYLFEKYAVPIFVVGGPGDTEEFTAMSQSLKEGTKIVSCLHHSIDELKAFMASIDLVVANDSAPIYIAETFNKATVVIIGPTDESEHPPTGQFHRMVKSKERGIPTMAAWSLQKEVVTNEAEARLQIEKVTVPEVIHAVDELIMLLKNQ